MGTGASEHAAGLGVEGLSLAHNCTGDDKSHTRAAAGASVAVWDGGSLLKVRLPGLRGGQGGGPRGAVVGFSRASRRRLLEKVHQVQQGEQALFLTLTLPDGLGDYSGLLLKRALRAFWARVRRRWPAAAALWRLEVVPRKSGEQIGRAVGHLHMLLWGIVPAPGLREWVAGAWYDVIGSGDVKHLRAGTRLDVPRAWDRVLAYAAKLYAAKEGDAGGGMIADPGRFWGFLSRLDVPWAAELVRALSPREAFRLLRIMRGWVKAERRWRGLSPPGGLLRWRSFYVGSGAFWADRLSVIGWLV